MKEKLRRFFDRLQELEGLLSQPELLADKEAYRNLTREHSYLLALKEASFDYDRLQSDLEENQRLLSEDSDEEMRQLLKEDILEIQQKLPEAKARLEFLLVPPDPNDDRNTIVEIRAGTGGEEAALFVGDCARMYKNFATAKRWNFEGLSATASEMGGFKEYIFVLSGAGVYREMRYEAGTHRVQRVPATETQGRVHTSTVTVAVLMEPDPQEKIAISESDISIETYRASGAGGQHVNVTDSAVRIRHILTGTVVTCQDERSQHKNKEKALRILSARVQEKIAREQQKKEADLRSSQVGSGGRPEKIRTYNFPQNRVTEHRIPLTWHDLDRIIEGEALQKVISALVAHFYEQKLVQ
ncbi:MAG: peptide chain release factor 1 [Chlamydiota bacterium]